SNKKFTRVNIVSAGERTSRDGAPHFFDSAENYIGPKPELLFEGSFYAVAEFREILLLAAEHYVPALYERLAVFQSMRLCAPTLTPRSMEMTTGINQEVDDLG